MAVLKNAGLVESRKEEKWIYYKLPEPAKRNKNVQSVLEWITGSLSTDPRIRQDSKNLMKILSQSPETICKNRVERNAKRKTRYQLTSLDCNRPETKSCRSVQ
jgi:DNA-binding transcriptional ArsR family regulator